MKTNEQPTGSSVQTRGPLAHRACLACWPEMVPGMRAFCGKELRGIPLPETSDKCIVCEDLRETHFKTCPNG